MKSSRTAILQSEASDAAPQGCSLEDVHSHPGIKMTRADFILTVSFPHHIQLLSFPELGLIVLLFSSMTRGIIVPQIDPIKCRFF